MSAEAGIALLAALCSIGCMKKTGAAARPTASAAAATTAVGAASPIDDTPVAPEAREPKLSFTVAVGDTRIRVTEGEAAVVPGTFQNPALTVAVEPTRLFTYAGLRFEYPRSFTFEANLDTSSSTWTLSGNDLKIMVFRFDEQVSTDEYVQELLKRFGPKTTSAPLQLRLGGVDYQGTRLDVRLAQTDLIYEVVGLPEHDGKYRLISIQDTKSAANVPEGVRARELLSRTFQAEK